MMTIMIMMMMWILFNHRTFANETSQFLAPYDQSVKSRSGGGGGGHECPSSIHNNHCNNNNSNKNGGVGVGGTTTTTSTTNDANTTGVGFLGAIASNPHNLSIPTIMSQSSISHAELANVSANVLTKSHKLKTNCCTMQQQRPSIAETVSARVEAWNPFEEQPFNPITMNEEMNEQEESKHVVDNEDDDEHSMEAEFDQIHQRGSHGSRLPHPNPPIFNGRNCLKRGVDKCFFFFMLL